MLTPEDFFSEFDSDDSKKYKPDYYREVMYDKREVEQLEQTAMREMLGIAGIKYSPSFYSKAAFYFPDEITRKRKSTKNTNMYFLEDVGMFLWKKWHSDKSETNQNNFVTYCYTLIDGVIFKYGRHKHGLSYGEIFQAAIIKLIQAMDKFNPARQVGTDDKGSPIYARVYTYFVMVLNYSITTITMTFGAEKLSTVSYDTLSRVINGEDHGATDASIIFQEFLLFLDSILEAENDFTVEQTAVIKKLRSLLVSPSDLHRLANNIIFTLKNEAGVKIKDVEDTLKLVRELFGPLIILSERGSLDDSISDN